MFDAGKYSMEARLERSRFRRLAKERAKMISELGIVVSIGLAIVLVCLI